MMLHATTATWRLITTSSASDVDGYMTSKYLKWISFSKVHSAWGSSHCCAVRWKSRLSAGAADLPRGERTPDARRNVRAAERPNEREKFQNDIKRTGKWKIKIKPCQAKASAR